MYKKEKRNHLVLYREILQINNIEIKNQNSVHIHLQTIHTLTK